MSVIKVRGELHCYNCGHIAAQVEGEGDGNNLKARLIGPANGPGVRLHRGQPPRCGRCGGKLYLDEVEIVRPKPAETSGSSVPLGSLFFPDGSTTPVLFPR